MKKHFLILISLITLTIAACGGGSSDSSDSSASGERFTGSQSIVIFGESDPEPFVMTLSNNTVTIIDDDFTATGTLDGSNFIVAVPQFSITDDGFTCVFNNLAYSGTLESADRVTGSISGSAVCDGEDIPFSGSFAANRG